MKTAAVIVAPIAWVRATLLALALLSAVADLGAAESVGQRWLSAVTPIQKVVQMLNGMLTKGKEEKHAEEVQYAAYKQFCDDTTTEKQRAIQEAENQIEMLTADIETADTEAVALGKKIQELDADVAVYDGDIKAATKVREKEREDYTKVHTDYSESIDAIEKAVQVVKAQAYNRPQAVSMLADALHEIPTSSRKAAPKAARQVIDAFLATGADPLDVTPPEAHGWEFRSQSIIDMLEKLRDKFADERSELEKEELSKRHSYDMLVQDLQKSITTAQDSRGSKVQQKAKELQYSATLKADLQDTESTKTENSKILTDLTTSCGQKAADFKERQKLREDEISAIEQAIGILSSDQVAGVTVYPTTASAASLLQVRSNGNRPDTSRAIAYLNKRADLIHSRVLSALALRVRDDPFAKVKKLIQELITRLMQEASEEATHKGWCDTELAENEQVRTSRTAQVESLASEIDEKKSSILKLGSEITQLTQDLAATEEQIAKDTQLRTEEKAANEATVKDAQEAQTAVGQAITVLKEFYERAAEATAFLEHKKAAVRRHDAAATQTPVAPAIFDSPYQGMGGENGGVVAMLEVIQSDYARLESTTSAMEATAAADFEKAMTDAAVTKATLQKDVEHKTHQKQTTEETVVNLENDYASSEKELEAANNYYDKLKPSCVDAGLSYEERVQRREEEIKSLEEALRILNGEDIMAPVA